jgi:AcrR family transcriptional regulator
MSVLKKPLGAGRRRRTYLPGPDRRAQILEVAKAVFAERGYHAANVAHICRAARIGRGTLYQYFDNKRAVMLSLLEDIAARVKRVFDERPQVDEIPGAASAPSALIASYTRQRVRVVLDAIFQDEQTLRLIVREARGLGGKADRLIAQIDEMMLAAMEADLKSAQRAGVLRALDARLVARFILGGVEKMVMTALARDEPVDLDAIAAVAVDIELFGLLAPDSSRRDA